MKALQLNGYGKIENNLAFSEVSIPEISDEQVLIEVHSAGVSPLEHKLVEGLLESYSPESLPMTIGLDVAGVVTKKGANVTDFELGDRVFSRVKEGASGAFAEFIAVDSDIVSKIPTNLTFAEASSIPLVGLTTLQAFQMSDLKIGDSVLIFAGSHGVGAFAIQYAKARGAYVYSTTDTDNIDLVKELGADMVVDYTAENYLEVIRDIDIVFDTLGGDNIAESFKVLREGGQVISVIGADNVDQNIRIAQQARTKRAIYKSFTMRPDGEQLREIKTLVEGDLIKPVIDREFDFSRAIEALHYQKQGPSRGNVVLNIK
jgi:NADPH:quinone reductase-like Zn-dependent oxidoreductase